jgi:hypothetical protein
MFIGFGTLLLFAVCYADVTSRAARSLFDRSNTNTVIATVVNIPFRRSLE